MIPQEYRDFFAAAVGASGALIGLLFVAITVSPERAQQPDTRTEFRIRASSALLVFSNALVLSLAALVPGAGGSLGWWCLASSLGIVLFALATSRSGLAELRRRPTAWRPFTLVCSLLVIAGFESWAGVLLVRSSSDLGALRTVNYVIISDLLMGIGRAWQLANMRDTGMVTSLRMLARGEELLEEELEEEEEED